MAQSFKYALSACGLSQQEAADFLGVSLETVKHWSAGRRPVPSGVWNMMAELFQRIQDAADFAADHMTENGIDPKAYHGIDADNGTDPLPDGAAAIAGAMALLMAIVLGVPLGLYAGMKPTSPLSKILMSGSILGFSLPAFWVALMLIMVFSVQLGWMPASGRGDTRSLLGIEWSFLTLDGLHHLLLPAFNLALFKLSLVLRLTRAGVREVLPQDFVKFARAKGLSETRVMCMHVLRNTMIPLVTVLGLELGSTIAYAVVTESIFAWPGAGKLILDSINSLDRPVVVAYLMVVVVIFVSLNLIVDLLYKLLDPRVRLEAAQ